MALVFRYKLVSHLPGSTTTTGNAFSGGAASFSPDGRYVLFESLASNLAGSDSNGGSDLFLYDSLDFSVDLVSHIPASTTTAANSATDAGGAFFSPTTVICCSKAVPRTLPEAISTAARMCSSTTRRTAASLC